MIKLQKVSQRDIVTYAEADFETSFQDRTKSEMAIPSYLHANPLVRWLMWRRYELIASWLEVDDKSTLLEFGCGTGIFLPTLCSRGSKVFALDLVPDIAKKLARENALEVVFADSVEEIEDESLDAIVAADVLEHIPDVQVTVAALRDKLKPGGRLFVSGPTENLAYKLLRNLVGFEGKGDYHFSNIDLLIPIIKNTGFSVRRAKALPTAFTPALFRVLEFKKNDL